MGACLEGDRFKSVIKWYMCCDIRRYKIAHRVWETPGSSVSLELRDYGEGLGLFVNVCAIQC